MSSLDVDSLFTNIPLEETSQLTFTCSKSTIEALEEDVK